MSKHPHDKKKQSANEPNGENCRRETRDSDNACPFGYEVVDRQQKREGSHPKTKSHSQTQWLVAVRYDDIETELQRLIQVI